ncbi:ABC transporter ATP-binding protein [Demequina gelatinilytica]|uniref:ABC transporter ATP-binding protein n=1 Tax=Demequina gelatinilytica TaxID=1638980 RepID=UPI0007858ABA|nr:ABC transporter ATP-binding protein [Demequina gelatinilytica]
MTRWLLTVARPVLAPLSISILMRTVALIGGVALLVVAVEGVTTAVDGGALAPVLWTLVAIALVKAFARYLEQYAGHYVAFKALALLRVMMFERLEPQAPAAVEGRRTGDLLSRATRDVDRVEVFFAHTIGPALTAVLVPLGVGTWLALAVSPAAAAVAAVGWVLMLGVASLGARASVTASAGLRERRGALAQHVTDTVQGVSEVIAFSANERRVAELEGIGRDTAMLQATRARWASARRGLTHALAVATPMVALAAALPLGWETAVVAAAAVLGATPAVVAVEEFAAELDQAYAAAARLREVMDAPPATPEPLVPATAPRGEIDVALTDVTFSYPSMEAGTDGDVPARRALDGATLSIPAGTTTALVGVSGAGKSTIGALIARFHDPGEGRVTLGGVDARDLADADLRRLVSVVPQRPYLFAGTIRDNLLLARPDATEDELHRACADAMLTDTLARMPQGLDTPVGEHGTQLSGGERQRVAIARALLRDAPVLVLDEITSQLDSATEAGLGEAMRAVRRGRAVAVIAHRLTSIVDADQIVVVDAGRIVERGTHHELLATGGAYARLWARQAAAEDAAGARR